MSAKFIFPDSIVTFKNSDMSYLYGIQTNLASVCNPVLRIWKTVPNPNQSRDKRRNRRLETWHKTVNEDGSPLAPITTGRSPYSRTYSRMFEYNKTTTSTLRARWQKTREIRVSHTLVNAILIQAGLLPRRLV
ncbi:hypothetical protein CAPTEDRAFT_223021 [Capitella teleta]|uniref:Uncharacterized protein n=1 Tax=Capitella teleta TaxID=283909 RepID=R7UIN6_CAPTE|nr:hypothetical protein CAPTEDRAFT_223021 [Capitella teleta]|eukprot:ELU03132.1 hypothetical protein CAPTEDRAFT_223021 [Capitella teleta]